jgi:Fuc2NAc and GlcNAc transferase
MPKLFNFMDGIDGIASVEAVAVALGGALVWWLAGEGTGWILALVFAACVAGFLIWNFPPARIFMGDAGSGFLGFAIGALSLWCSQAAAPVLELVHPRRLLHGRFERRSCGASGAATVQQAHRVTPTSTRARVFAHEGIDRLLAITLAWRAAVMVALGGLDRVTGLAVPMCRYWCSRSTTRQAIAPTQET